MSAPKRIQLRRTKGWRKPDGAIVVSRPSPWGNPFRVGELAQHMHPSGAYPYDLYLDVHRVQDAQQAVGLFRKILTERDEHQYVGYTAPPIRDIRRSLAGHDLACWCPLDQPCHADVLLEIANTKENP